MTLASTQTPLQPTDTKRTPAWPALLLYWGNLVAAVALPPFALALSGRHTLVAAWQTYWQSFVGAEPGLMAVLLLHAAPFVILAIFSLLHLGRAPAGRARWRVRLGACALASASMIALSLWLMTAILASRSSTAGLGFLVLPFYLAGGGVIAYGLGRLFATLTARYWRT